MFSAKNLQENYRKQTAGFSKKHIKDPNDPEYIKTFIVECNKGTVEHFVSIFAGFLCIFIFPLKYALVIGVPVAIINVILNILPIFILRYNIPKLKVVLKRAERVSARNEENADGEENKLGLNGEKVATCESGDGAKG